MAEEKQEGQKTIVSFVVGLLIGGLLVWAFSGPAEEVKVDETPDGENAEQVDESETESESTTTNEEVPTPGDKGGDTPVKAVLPVGDGKISVVDQTASAAVVLASATYPVSEGWVGVRDYEGEQLGGLLGVVRFSEEQGLVPSQIVLQRPTIAGRSYAVVVYEENGDRQFNLAEDVQIDSVFATFTAK